MRVFITGSSGFVGGNIFKRCHDCDSYLYERDEGISGLLAFNPDVIFHCAGEIYDEGKMYDSNVRLTHALLEASRMISNLKAFIFIGSSSEYGRKSHPMKETDYLDPTNLYEATKGAATLLCQGYARRYRLPVMIARPFSLYGPGEPDHRFIPTLIRSCKAGWEMKIAPGVHDFIHINDFVNGLYLLCDHPQSGEIYNFGTGIQLTNQEVVDIVQEIVRRNIKAIKVPKMHDYDTTKWVSNITKAKALGWEPKISFEEGIKELCHHT